MTWWQTVPYFAATLLLTLGPGAGLLAMAGIRGLSLAALSAPVSFTVVSCLGVAAPWFGLPFFPSTYLLASLALVALTGVVRIILARRNGGSWFGRLAFVATSGKIATSDLGRITPRLALPVALLLSGGVIAYRYLVGFGDPSNFSQTFDNVYHLNAIRRIVDTQNGSSLTIGNLTDASQGFYPAAMHDMIALVVHFTGASIPIAVNLTTIAIGAVIWPLSCLFLVARVVGYRAVPILITGAFASGFSSFPYLMVAFGVLYPNHLAIALLPAALGLALEALRVAKARTEQPWGAWVLLVVCLPGLSLAHPSTTIALLAFALPALLFRLVAEVAKYRRRETSGRKALWWAFGTAGYVGAVLVVWIKLRPSLSAAPWGPFQTNARAIGEVVANAPMGTTITWIMTPATVLGLYILARHVRKMWWILGMYVVGAVLYIIASSWSLGGFRTFMVGVWYNDSFRLAALLPVVTLPVAVFGAEWVVWRVRALLVTLRHSEQLHGWLTAFRNAPGWLTSTAPVWLLIVFFCAGSQGGTLSNVQSRLDDVFALKDTSALITPDKLAIIEKAKELIPAGDSVVANPYMGGALVYALADRQAVAPHIFGTRNPTEEIVLDHWDEASYNTQVCPAIRELRAYWALDFGTQTVIPTDSPNLGVNDLTTNLAPGVEVKAQVGNARLFRVTVCS
ncbi:DUF6541 family protein [Sinomonas sp. P10A9]|uniref:DUF6541 family protein n=1 Tax=Sinomonas puerhi TaxID=3238584 RepID=A0AB39KZQ5_9MICC